MTPLWPSLLAAAALAATPAPSAPPVPPAPLGSLAVRVVSDARQTDGCTYEASYAQLEGLADAAVSAKVNARLKELGTQKDACANPPAAGGAAASDDDAPPEQHQASSAAAAVLGGRYLLVQSSAFDFTGGAHGNGGSSCEVLDLRTGEPVSLAGKMTPGALALVHKRIVAEVYDGDQTAADSFLSGSLQVGDAGVCPNGHGLAFHFNPYEIASYADGEKSIAVGPNDWRAYFVVDEVTNAVFAGGSAPIPEKKAAPAKSASK
jgi:hypothetical protein